MTTLDCSENSIIHLDLSSNTGLTSLIANTNALSSIDLTTNIALEELDIANNRFTEIDISHLSNLSVLNCNTNDITVLELNSNLSLEDVNCASNNLGVLIINNGFNNLITSFNAISNPLLRCIVVDDPDAISDNANGDYDNWLKDNTAIYSSSCDALTYVPDDNFEQALIDLMYDDVLDNFVLTDSIITRVNLNISGLMILDLTGVEDFIALDTLNCSNNQISNLDLTSNMELTILNCNDNLLNSLNVKNSMITTFDATSNPNLFCIEVDDVDAANTDAGWVKDDQASYSLNCSGRQTYVPDDNFEQALIDLGYDSGVLDDNVPTSNIEGLLDLDVSKKNIFDLTGIENFVALDSLNCSGNYLTALNVTRIIITTKS